MKSGTGDDPFADDAADESEATTDADVAPDDGGDGNAPPDESADAGTPDEASDADGESSADDASAAETSDDDAPDIPWVLRRSSVKADRPNVTQFFLRDETDRAERRFQSDVEDILDADVYTLDLREAAYIVAMRHPDEVAAELRDWGYEYLE